MNAPTRVLACLIALLLLLAPSVLNIVQAASSSERWYAIQFTDCTLLTTSWNHKFDGDGEYELNVSAVAPQASGYKTVHTAPETGSIVLTRTKPCDLDLGFSLRVEGTAPQSVLLTAIERDQPFDDDTFNKGLANFVGTVADNLPNILKWLNIKPGRITDIVPKAAPYVGVFLDFLTANEEIGSARITVDPSQAVPTGQQTVRTANGTMQFHYTITVSPPSFKDGTLVREQEPTSEKIYLVMGGAKLWLEYEEDVQWASAYYHTPVLLVPSRTLRSLPNILPDGTLIKGNSTDGSREGQKIFVIYNGSKFHVYDGAELPVYYPHTSVTILPDRVVRQLPTTPRRNDAMTIRERSSKQVYLVGDERKRALTTTQVNNYGGPQDVYVVPAHALDEMPYDAPDETIIKGTNNDSSAEGDKIFVLYKGVKFHVYDGAELPLYYPGIPVTIVPDTVVRSIPTTPPVDEPMMVRERLQAQVYLISEGRKVALTRAQVVSRGGERAIYDIPAHALDTIP